MDSVVFQGREAPAKGTLGLERHQFPAQERLFPILLQVVVKPLLGYLVQIGVQVVHIAEIVQQLYGGLGANLRDPRNVVAGISHERQVIPNLFRREAVFFHHLVRAKVYAVGTLGQMEQVNLVGHNLGHVLVLGKNHHMVKARLYRSGGHAGHHVVGLVAGLRKQRNSAGLHALSQKRHLGGHFFGHGPAIGLVVRVKIVPECLGVGHVPSDGKMGRLVLCQNTEYRSPVAVHHGDVFALAVHQGVLAIGVKHAERKRVRIKEQ